MNKQLLESFMKLNGDTGISLSAHLDMSRTTFSAKINESRGAEFTQSEMQLIKERYDLSADAMYSIFFNENVSKKDTFDIVKIEEKV